MKMTPQLKFDVEDGALEGIPIMELAQFLASHGCEMAANTRGGMTIRKMRRYRDER